MAIELAFGLAANFEKVSGGTPSLDLRNGHKVIGLATSEDVVYRARMSSAYASGSNATLKVGGTATATSGTLKLQAAFEALASQDIDSDGFNTAIAADADPTVSGTSGVRFEATWTLSQSQMDAIAAGGWFRLKILRVSTGDTMTGDFEFADWAITQ